MGNQGVRILKVHNRYRTAGGERQTVATEAEWLTAAGHDVRFHQAQNPDRLLPSLPKLAVSAWNPASALRIRADAKAFRPDVAHVHNTRFALSPSVITALHRLGIPVVMTLHNYRLVCTAGSLFRDGAVCTDCIGTHPWRGALHACVRDSRTVSALEAARISVNRSLGTWERDVDAFITPTEQAKSLLASGGIGADRISVVPSAVSDTGPRATAPSASNEVLFVGRLTPEKGAEFVLDAWRRADTGRMRLTVIGDGPERSRLEAIAPAGVGFVGELPAEATRTMMKRARALLFASLWFEPFGRVVVEAIAEGLPVVCSDRGVGSEVGRHLETGFLVDPGDMDGWVDSLESLDDGKRLDEAGVAGRALYESRFAPHHTGPRLEAVLRAAIVRD
jgi:glycosyltransferase involved in cell wall biosynthesis